MPSATPPTRPLPVGSLFRVALLAGALVVAGCSASPLETYDLNSPTPVMASRGVRGVLVIAEPSATPPADGDRIVVRTGRDSVSVLKGAQWVDRLTRLVQLRLLHTFENAHLLRSVGRPEDGLTADYRLMSEIRRFEIEGGTGQATVEISVKLVREGAGRIVAAQIFSARGPGSAADGASATAALDAVLSDVMTQIVRWAAPRA